MRPALTAVIKLDARLDTAAAEPLQTAMSAVVGKDISLDGSGVHHLGGRCLEVLLRVRHGAQAAGHTVELLSPSDALVDDLGTFGLTPDAFSTGGTT